MIQYKIVPSKKITEDFLKGYIRDFQTTKVKYVSEEVLKEKEDRFFESWDDEKLNSICRYMSEDQRLNIIAYDKKQVAGFLVIDLKSFDGYMNVPYIHTDKRYRGKGVGKNMLLYASKLVLDMNIKKLYISAHPSVEAIAFYQALGCELTKNINQELYEIEPYDIQLERVLEFEDIIYRKIEFEFKNIEKLNSTTLMRILPRVYKFMPKDINDYIRVCRRLIKEDHRYFFSLGTLLLKKREESIDINYLPKYEETLMKDINGWGQVDQYCYRVLGPIFNSDYNLVEKLREWSHSENKDVRRASLVSMLTSSGKVTCTYPLNFVLEFSERLKEDEDFHVRKAVGWLLKCAYVEYPNEIKKYLIDNVSNLDRLIFRYALEHVDKETKKELMNL